MKIWHLGLLLLAGWTAPLEAQNTAASNSSAALLLQEACEDGKLDQVKTLIEQQGVSVDATSGRDNSTPLIAAAHAGHVDVLQYLIGKHANLDLADHNGSTPLLHASWQHHDDCALALIDAGANVNLGSHANCTPLMYAARHGDVVLVKALLAKKVELDTNCTLGTAVVWAAGNNQMATVRLLGDAGAKLDILPTKANTFSVLAMAAVANNTEMIDYLLQHGMNVDFPDGDGETPLMAASWSGHLEAAQHLLDAKANINLQNQKGETALMIAPDRDTARFLVAAHPNLELRNKKDQTVLLADASFTVPGWVPLLVEAGADVNATDAHGETALTIVGDRGDLVLIDYLKGKGATRTDLHIIAKKAPEKAPSPAQAWALAVAAIYIQRDGLNPQTLGSDRSRNSNGKELLKRDWSITDKASLLRQLDDLRDEGHHTAYRTMGQFLVSLTDDKFDQFVAAYPNDAEDLAATNITDVMERVVTRPDDATGLAVTKAGDAIELVEARLDYGAKLKAMKASYLKWKERTGMAWDLCRAALLVNTGYAVGYLPEQEAWDRLMAIAHQTQSTFTSWQEMSDNFLDGRGIWNDGKRDPQFDACAQLLLNPKDPNSPWNQIPWKTDLPSAPSGATVKSP